MSSRPIIRILLYFVCVMVVLGTPLDAHALPLLLDNFGDVAPSQVIRNPGESILTRIEVGPENVKISSLGTHGWLLADGSAKSLIFQGNPPSSGVSPVLQSGAFDFTSATDQWFDIPVGSFTLQASNVYYMGVTFNQFFRYDTEFNTGANSDNGLTSPGSPSLNNNGNASGFVSPTFTNTGNVQVSIRINGKEEIPDPVTGDFDDDGDVDGFDFLAWQQNPSLEDLSDWQANYGTPITASTATVPSPASITLALVFVGLSTAGRRR